MSRLTQLPEIFSFQGGVIYGEKVGRTIDFPTANLDFQPTTKDLKTGVYFGTVKIREKPSSDSRSRGGEYYCLAYFGPRHIFGEEKNNFEIFIYDFDREIYGEEILGKLSHFIRPPRKFKGLKNLQAQLQHDMDTGYKLIAEDRKKLA